MTEPKIELYKPTISEHSEPMFRPEGADYYHYIEDPDATQYFFSQLNDLRLRLYNVKLAKLKGTIYPLAADVHINSLTKQIRLVRCV